MDETANRSDKVQRDALRAAKALGRSRSGQVVNRFLSAQMEGTLRRLRRTAALPTQRSEERTNEAGEAVEERRVSDS